MLSIIGIYGVMAYYVQQHRRTSASASRSAAAPVSARLVVGQGMKVVAGGVAIGLLAALMLTRLMSSLLFGVGAADALPTRRVHRSCWRRALGVRGYRRAAAIALQPASVLRND